MSDVQLSGVSTTTCHGVRGTAPATRNVGALVGLATGQSHLLGTEPVNSLAQGHPKNPPCHHLDCVGAVLAEVFAGGRDGACGAAVDCSRITVHKSHRASRICSHIGLLLQGGHAKSARPYPDPHPTAPRTPLALPALPRNWLLPLARRHAGTIHDRMESARVIGAAAPSFALQSVWSVGREHVHAELYGHK
jgi:hypothetical protein